jgi:hypothetical protein
MRPRPRGRGIAYLLSYSVFKDLRNAARAMAPQNRQGPAAATAPLRKPHSTQAFTPRERLPAFRRRPTARIALIAS